MNTHAFENLIYSFFKAVQFKVRVKDENGDIFIAREWYVVLLGILASVIEKSLTVVLSIIVTIPHWSASRK